MTAMGTIESVEAPPRNARRRWLACASLCAVLWPALVVAAEQPAPPAELKPPAKPTAMPAFVLPTTAGATLDSKALAGQVLVIRFWASW